MSIYVSLFGSTKADRRRSWGIIRTMAIVWPFAAALWVWDKAGRPGCRPPEPSCAGCDMASGLEECPMHSTWIA